MTPVKDIKLIRKILKKPIRTCYTMHECFLCKKTISCGERYYDGGYGKRAHYACIQQRSWLR